MNKIFTRISLIVFLLFATVKIYSQNYNISFAATGATTTVSTVIVVNLTQNISVTLNGNDILNLGHVGINETGLNNENLQIYPNPTQGSTEIAFYVEQKGNAQITINDITGKEVLRFDNRFTKGIHKFQLNGLKKGMYFVNIKSETYLYSSKLISQNTSQGEAVVLEYLGYENEKVNKLKNTNSTVNMPYNNGDRLLFRGVSGNYANIITDIPTSSKTITFNFIACTDADNNNYATVQIDTQIWMAENLKTTKYNNGTPIPNVTDDTAWSNLYTPAYCWYDNNQSTYGVIYGALYNWYTVNTSNLCPTGWHVPTDAEWTTLTDYLGGNYIAGGKLKETGALHWLNPNTGASNLSGFTALPGGNCAPSGSFFGIGGSSYWWSATEYNANNALRRGVHYSYSYAYRDYSGEQSGLYVRCVKD